MEISKEDAISTDKAKANEALDFESTMVIAPEPKAQIKNVEIKEAKANEPPDFESTMVITPDATLSNKPAGNSTDAFIDRVKEQLSSSEKSSDDKDGAYISTTPV